MKLWGQVSKREQEREQHPFNLNKTNEYITAPLLSAPLRIYMLICFALWRLIMLMENWMKQSSEEERIRGDRASKRRAERAPLVTTSDFGALSLCPLLPLPPDLASDRQRGNYLGSGNSKPMLVFVYTMSSPSIPTPSNVSAVKNQNWSWNCSWIG